MTSRPIDDTADQQSRSGTLGTVLTLRATTHADKPFLLTRARSFTFREFSEECNRVAHGLAAQGVVRGSRVMVALPNRAEVVVVWFALARLGAVYVPLNAAFKGPSLAAMINQARSPLLVTDLERLGVVREVVEDLAELTTVVLLDGGSAPRSPWRIVPWSAIRTDRTDDPPAVAVPSDPVMFLFTSGTTGRSKACVLSHRYLLRHASLMARGLRLTEADVNYTAFPLFYIDATVYAVGSALLLGATAAIGERFSASSFWDDIRFFDATNFDFVGATLAFLFEQPPTPDDRRHRVRLAWGIPLPPFTAQFEERFGVRLVDGYGLTEAGVPIWRSLDEPTPEGSSGKVCRELFDVRIFDDDDQEVPAGTIGEIVIRPLEPSIIIDGYFGMPEATVAMWRNLWLHTGDLGRFDPEGFFYFEGRKKDVIRRRGQNISAFEIEEVVNGHPAVLESAAYGVSSAVSEDEVMVAVCLNQGATLRPAELAAHCAQHLAGYMVPRFIDIVADLPRTTTDKVNKAPLRALGVTPSTWDREAQAGDGRGEPRGGRAPAARG
jgi:crotonobetaine/carnitine-CoA ligase